jgi:redox-sensing transcriptional repressor
MNMLSRLDRQGVTIISSHNLAAICNVGSSQLRKDLMPLPGAIGKQKVGYSVKALLKSVTSIMHRDAVEPVILVGVGSFGSALLKYQNFESNGFQILAAFDLCPRSVEGSTIAVHGMDVLGGFLEEHSVQFAILAVPESAAKNVTDLLVRLGVNKILNLTPALLNVPDTVKVSNVNLVYELEYLRRQT